MFSEGFFLCLMGKDFKHPEDKTEIDQQMDQDSSRNRG